jgi:hypothetical protein
VAYDTYHKKYRVVLREFHSKTLAEDKHGSVWDSVTLRATAAKGRIDLVEDMSIEGFLKKSLFCPNLPPDFDYSYRSVH